MLMTKCVNVKLFEPPDDISGSSYRERIVDLFVCVSLSDVRRILKFLVGLAWENVVNMTSPMWRFYRSIKRVTIVANMDWSYVHSLRSELSLYVLLNPEVWQWMQQDENILFLTVSTEFKCLLHLPDLICFSGHYVGSVVSISPFWDKSVMQRYWIGITGELRKWNFHIYIYIYIGLIIDTYCTLTRLVSPERRVIKFQ